MIIGNSQIIQYQGSIHRIQIYMETYSLPSGEFLSSGEVAYLTFTIKKNEVEIKSIQVNYDDAQESDIIHDEIVDLSVKPGNIITVEAEETGVSGLVFTWNKANVKLICSKIHY